MKWIAIDDCTVTERKGRDGIIVPIPRTDDDVTKEEIASVIKSLRSIIGKHKSSANFLFLK